MTPKAFHALVMSFPETVETASHGQAGYKAFGRFFTRLRPEDDSIVIGQVDFDEREMLCEAEPGTFHYTDHYKRYRYVLARLKPLDKARAKAYLFRQWRSCAPRKWLRTWDAEQGS